MIVEATDSIKRPHAVRGKRPTAIFVANRSFALAKSRLLIMKQLVRRAWRVVGVGRADSHVSALRDAGVEFEEVVFGRGGVSPNRDWKAFWQLSRLYSQLSPTLIHHFQAKPVILGGSAAGRLHATTVVNSITGLGHAFIAGGLAKQLAILGYRVVLRRAETTVFQNPDDQQLFLKNGLLTESKARLIVSSGVDTLNFRPKSSESSHGAVTVLMLSRMLWEKGVGEFVEAAQRCKPFWPGVRFQLAGEMDPEHPDAVPKRTIDAWIGAGDVEFLGYIKNVEELLQRTTVAVLPSYREGVPRVLLEASACGVPTVAADTPGCREAVEHGVTGLLVPAKDSSALANAIARLLSDPEMRRRMGQRGVERAAEEFDERTIARKYLDLYREIGVDL